MDDLLQHGPFQFAHLLWAARVRTKRTRMYATPHGKSRSQGWSAADLLHEAARSPGHCAHVSDPQPPTLIAGCEPLAVLASCMQWAGSVTQSNGKPLRRDSPVLAAGVVSYPRECDDQWPAYRDAVVGWLRQMYGERLRCVVEHADEAHPHLHFYLVPLPGEPFGAVHPGYAASRAARRQRSEADAGPAPGMRTAYIRAMRDWQDRLFAEVSVRFGLQRLGPRRERYLLDRQRAQVEDAQASAGRLVREWTEQAALSRRQRQRAQRLLQEAEEEAQQVRLLAAQEYAAAKEKARELARKAHAVYAAANRERVEVAALHSRLKQDALAADRLRQERDDALRQEP